MMFGVLNVKYLTFNTPDENALNALYRPSEVLKLAGLLLLLLLLLLGNKDGQFGGV